MSSVFGVRSSQDATSELDLSGLQAGYSHAGRDGFGSLPGLQGGTVIRRRKRKTTSKWTISDITFVVIGLSVLLGIVAVGVRPYFQVVPKLDPDKVAVETWLKEHIEDGKWEEDKWYPAMKLQALHDINLLHIIESMEKAKTAYEKGLGGTENDCVELQKHYQKFRDTGARTFCAMKYRTATLNGKGTLRHAQVFEIVDGRAQPCTGNDIVETPSSPLKRSQHPAIYDGLRLFADPEYKPFPAVSTENFEARVQAAMVWKAPATAVAAVAPPQPQVQVQQKPPASASKADAKHTEVIPQKIREYFERATQAKSAEISKLEKRLSDFKARLRGTKKVVEQTALTDRIRQTEDKLVELKMIDFTGFFPEKPEIGDIGTFQALEVIDIVDEETMIVRWLPNGKGRVPRFDVVIQPIETKDVKIGDEAVNADFLRITATKAEPSELLTKLKSDGKAAVFVAEPIDNQEIEKWRNQFEKDSKPKK